MAENYVHATSGSTNAASASAFFEAAAAFEDVSLDLERVSETAIALASSEAYGVTAQYAFHALHQLCDQLHGKMKQLEDDFTSLSIQNREA